jgi:hypothetical protein
MSPKIRYQVSHPYKITENISFVYSDFYVFMQSPARRMFLDLMVTNITRIKYPPNSLLNKILIFCSYPEIHELRHICKESVTFLYVSILSYILVTRY